MRCARALHERTFSLFIIRNHTLTFTLELLHYIMDNHALKDSRLLLMKMIMSTFFDLMRMPRGMFCGCMHVSLCACLSRDSYQAIPCYSYTGFNLVVNES